ncbi:7764_t:CDS:2, partial [Acaulospora morrowiae]
CEKRLYDNKALFDKNLNRITVNFSPHVLRKMWNVHPSIGLCEELTFEVVWNNEFWIFICIKEWIGDEKSLVKCEVSGVTLIGTELVMKLVEELKVLGEMEK